MFSLFLSLFLFLFLSLSFSFALPFALPFFLSLHRIESNRVKSDTERRSYEVSSMTRCIVGKVKRAREREIESGHDVHLVEYEQHWRACTAIG